MQRDSIRYSFIPLGYLGTLGDVQLVELIQDVYAYLLQLMQRY